jgi:hypothetical protein
MFGKAKDPTADWPPAGAPPVLHLDPPAAGALPLGGSFEGARSLGRPVRASGSAAARLLQYESFHLEFNDDRLVCAQFDLDEGDSVAVGDYRLTPATKPIDVQVWFGDPASDSSDGNRRWIDYERAGATLALEFTGNRLTCVQLYAEGYA